jgi:hypothetical protein
MKRRLNPPMMEVAKVEILKLLDAWVIYAIMDNMWVAPIHMLHKKTRITLVKKHRWWTHTYLYLGWLENVCWL